MKLLIVERCITPVCAVSNRHAMLNHMFVLFASTVLIHLRSYSSRTLPRHATIRISKPKSNHRWKERLPIKRRDRAQIQTTNYGHYHTTQEMRMQRQIQSRVHMAEVIGKWDAPISGKTPA